MSTSPLQRVVLMGFMGSGKTTVGRLLAARFAWDFTDLDDAIVQRTGLTIPDMFARHGEPRFRREEAATLAECLRRSGIVLALGGGAPETPENRQLLQASPGTAVVYLEGPFATLQARCLVQAEEAGALGRPILADPRLASQRFHQRVPIYRALATLTVSTLDLSPESVSEQIDRALGLNSSSSETP